MDIQEYFKSLSSECATLKDRVRMLIEGNHWPTDGEWKESVLRNMIRRSSPENLTIGRGFVVDHDRCSTQIDVLVYDNSFPVIYRESDLVFVTPSSCRAIIEVKSKQTASQFNEAAERLANDAEFIRSRNFNRPLFTGLFSYEISTNNKTLYLNALQSVSKDNELRIIDHAALGESEFIKYWDTNPNDRVNTQYKHWHLYHLEKMSFGYFIHNLLAEAANNLTADGISALFPTQTKEMSLLATLKFDEN